MYMHKYTDTHIMRMYVSNTLYLYTYIMQIDVHIMHKHFYKYMYVRQDTDLPEIEDVETLQVVHTYV